MSENSFVQTNFKKMSAFSLLRNNLKPYKGFSQLAIGNHEISRFKLVKNKMYNSSNPASLPRIILVELKDQVLFLPEYFAHQLA